MCPCGHGTSCKQSANIDRNVLWPEKAHGDKSRFTPMSLITLFLKKPKEMRRQFAKLEHLDLSYNGLDAQEASKFVNMALGNERPRLKYLDLSGNPEIGDTGCRSIFELLQAKHCNPEEVKMENTGITSETSRYIAMYLSRRRWTNLGIHDGYASYLNQHLLSL
ncbi:hypothetical protein BGZ65_001820 [Modicella reniformis]|uniref:Uncharacterized protein n=1 Tax=Modicella reniformis TaxID=1440133 RepID=A0A9P6J6N5_9FUNG|nr:hypothetical protein BGZ65_001820 [Modicella reniformis]